MYLKFKGSTGKILYIVLYFYMRIKKYSAGKLKYYIDKEKISGKNKKNSAM